MRTLIVVLSVALMAGNLSAQPDSVMTRVNVFPAAGGRDPLASGAGQQQAAAATAAYEIEEALLAAQQREIADIYAKDPWRKIGNATNRAYGKGWVEFQGIVQEASADGVLFKGAWGPVPTIRPEDVLLPGHGSVPPEYTTFYGDNLFFVADFPYSANEGLTYIRMVAREDGSCSYTNAAGQSLNVPKLTYGEPCVKIWSPEDLAAARRELAARDQAIQDRVLMSNRILADQGDPYGLRRMGERYRDGDGVPKDLAKARDYLSQAIAAGSLSAVDELANLNQTTNAPAAN